MAKKRTQEEDKAALEKKVQERRAGGNPEGDKDARLLRKRLKRVQRKIRCRTARIAMAAGKKAKAA